MTWQATIAIKNMPKKSIYISIAVVSSVILIALGYFGWVKWKEYKLSPEDKTLNNAGESADKITDSASKGVLPPIQVNPLDNQPDVNPADKANPFKNIKTNPFD